MPRELLPFLAVVAVLTITPGPDMALVLRNGVRGGSSAAWWTALGCITGIAVASRRTAYRQGLVTNLLNPKIALLFLALIPQFVAAGEPAFRTTGFLAATFLVIAIVWWRAFSLGVGALGGVLARPRVRTWLERLTGCVLVALGARVVFLR